MRCGRSTPARSSERSSFECPKRDVQGLGQYNAADRPLESLTCNDPSGGTTTDVSGAVANISLVEREEVVCESSTPAGGPTR